MVLETTVFLYKQTKKNKKYIKQNLAKVFFTGQQNVSKCFVTLLDIYTAVSVIRWLWCLPLKCEVSDFCSPFELESRSP